MNTRAPLYAAICILIVIGVAVAYSYQLDYQNFYRQQTPIGNCTLTNALKGIGMGTLTCMVGDRYMGFKLLAVTESGAQILIYNRCLPCAQPANETQAYNELHEIINVSVGQTFGGICEGEFPSKLVSVNVSEMEAVFEENLTSQGVCV